jgi:hypothetical protein
MSGQITRSPKPVDDYETPIDKMIREAREKGAFDNLPGKGKPIQWEDESLVPEDQRLANHLLRSNGFTLDWIQLGQEIEAAYEALSQRLERARADWTAGKLDSPGWAAERDRFNQQVRAINRRIIGYNLRVPHESLQRRPFSTEPD